MKSLSILMNAAIGDAWGACFEYAPRTVIEQNLESWSYFSHHKYDLGNGRYTDDLQMHLAVAEVLLSDNDYNRSNFTRSFVEVFKRDPREGYASRFYEFLVSVKNAEDFASRIRNDSEKSGGAMRAACIGTLSDIDTVKHVCEVQAGVTHNTPKGIGAAQAAALMLHFLLYKIGERKDLPDFLNKHVPVTDWNDLPIKKIGHLGIDSAKAALRAVVSEHSLQDILRSVIRCGGDTDTAATIALAVAGCSTEIDKSLPQALIDGLEDGPFGKDYIQSMDKKLTAFAIQQGAPL